MALGALLYAGISWGAGFMRLSDALGVDLRPGIVIPIVFGFVFGPVVGFVVGLLGNALGDLASFHAWYWNWSLGNGLLGLIPGLAALRWPSYRTLRDQIRSYGIALLGIAVGMAVAALLDIWICRPGSTNNAACSVIPVTLSIAVFQEFLPVLRVNAVTALILTPIILFNIEHLDLHSMDWFHSGLLRRLLLAVAVSAALPTALLGFFLLQQFSGQAAGAGDVMLRLILTIALTLIFTVVNALMVAQSISRPLLRLARAAGLMETGSLTQELAGDLRLVAGNDEIAQLSKVFGRMAQEVILRELALRRQVEELRIEIDETKRQAQVSEIVESDFFQNLQERARTLRQRKRQGGEETPMKGVLE